MLSHISKKHKHIKELIYREEQERYNDNKREMSVTLNFKGDRPLAVMRLINAQGKSEYFINGMPTLLEDYIQKITGPTELGGYNLNINNFCVFQGKLEELFFNQADDQSKLTQLFEELSSSIELKPECERLKNALDQCDEDIKQSSEALQRLKLEKVKQKGLQEFAQQINECLKDQKQAENQIHLAEILLSDKTLEALSTQIAEYEEGLSETEKLKAALLQDMRKFEAEQRKMNNRDEELQRSILAKKGELLDFQSSSLNKQRTLESTKALIIQKKSMLQKEKEADSAVFLRKQ